MAPLQPADSGSELAARLVSGSVLALVAVGAALAGGWIFAFVALALALGLVWEWFQMTRAAGRWAAFAAVVAVWVALVAQGSVVLALYCVVMGSIGTAMFALFARSGEGGGWAAGGALYATIPLVALLWIGFAPAGGLALLWLFIAVWVTDIGAFAAGRTFKGPKLAPAISPSKTWSGAAGGLACAALFGATLAPFLLDNGMGRGAVLGLVVGLSAEAGDLLESRIKRRFGAKDSGKLIPGHGGIMDRLDSLVAAAPVFALAIVAASPAGEGP